MNHVTLFLSDQLLNRDLRTLLDEHNPDLQVSVPADGISASWYKNDYDRYYRITITDTLDIQQLAHGTAFTTLIGVLRMSQGDAYSFLDQEYGRVLKIETKKYVMYYVQAADLDACRLFIVKKNALDSWEAL